MRIEIPDIEASKLSGLSGLPEGVTVQLSREDVRELIKHGKVVGTVKRLSIQVPRRFLEETEPGRLVM